MRLPDLRPVVPDTLVLALLQEHFSSPVADLVLVEGGSVARTLAETAWMLDLARREPHIAGVVGWVDLAAPDVEAMLDHLARAPVQRNSPYHGRVAATAPRPARSG